MKTRIFPNLFSKTCQLYVFILIALYIFSKAVCYIFYILHNVKMSFQFQEVNRSHEPHFLSFRLKWKLPMFNSNNNNYSDTKDIINCIYPVRTLFCYMTQFSIVVVTMYLLIFCFKSNKAHQVLQFIFNFGFFSLFFSVRWVWDSTLQ